MSFPYFISPEQAMRERSELARTPIEGTRSSLRVRCELRAAHVADHERVSGDHEPGAFTAGVVHHHEPQVLRRMTRQVQNA